MLLDEPLMGFRDIFGDRKILMVGGGPFEGHPLSALETVRMPIHVQYLGFMNKIETWSVTKDETGTMDYLVENQTIRQPTVAEMFDTETIDILGIEECEKSIADWYIIDDSGWMAIRLAL